MKRREFVAGVSTLGALGLLPWSARAQVEEEAAAGSEAAAPVLPTGPESQQAFRELLELLGEASERTLGPEWNVTNPADVPDGLRLILHLLAGAIDLYFEADPERPQFVPIVSPTRKFLGDNPDALYFLSPLRGDRSYRIKGNRAGAVYTSFTFQSADDDGIAGEIFATRNDTEFDVAPDGSYELVVGPGATGRNAVALAPDAVSITTRHYFENERPAAMDSEIRIPLSIEPFEDPGPPTPPDDARMAARIRRASAFVRQNTLGMPPTNPAEQPAWVSTVPNQIGKPELFGRGGGSQWGAVDNAYAMGPVLLEPDQALVIEGRIPECSFANVVLWNRFMQTYDYRHRRVSLNRAQMERGEDGSFRIVVAHRDPGVPNWIDAAGRPSGTLFMRFLLPKGDIPQPRTRVVAVDSLSGPAQAEALPEGRVELP